LTCYASAHKNPDRLYFGWVLLFDDPAYADIPIEVLHRAFESEGLPFFRAEGPIYDFILFNVDREAYRIDKPCTVTEQACSRILWLLHAYLGLEHAQLEKIGDAIERVMCNTDQLRSLSRARAGMA
jgi:hypothetical protein